MKKVLSLLLLSLLILSACGAGGIDKSDPKGSAEYIKKKLSIEDDIEKTQEEYYQGVMDGYSVGENINVLANEEGSIEQINFSNVDETNIQDILKMIDYPEVDSINNLTEKYYTDTALTGSHENNFIFTSYDGVGISASTTMDILKNEGDKPFSLSLYFNPDRFDKLRESTLKYDN